MATTSTSPSTVSTWKVDPAHSTAEFKVRHMMISNVKGRFTGISGTLSLDESDPARSHVEASIDVATIHSGDADRDGHLKGAEFFDAEKYPAMTFKSTHVERKSASEFAVTGELSIRGVPQTVTFAVEEVSEPAKDPWGNLRLGLAASTRINRKQYGLNWNAALESGGFLVGDEVTLNLEIQFIKG